MGCVAQDFETSLQGVLVGEEMSWNINLPSAVISHVSVEIKHSANSNREEINHQIKCQLKCKVSFRKWTSTFLAVMLGFKITSKTF